MGFLRRIFGSKKSSSSKERKTWSSSRSPSSALPSENLFLSSRDGLDANKHAIAVAAATAAVAEAALAASRAAAEVVKLTSGSTRRGGGSSVYKGGKNHHRRAQEYLAAVRIQSGFRGYLARRALRALKALVKLQALVRGHIVRKQTTDMLKRMQTLVRLQARARITRASGSESFHSVARSSSQKNKDRSKSNPRDIIKDKAAHVGPHWLDRWMEENVRDNDKEIRLRHRHIDDDKSVKILEVDTWKPRLKSQQRKIHFVTQTLDSPRQSPAKVTNPILNVSSNEVLSLGSTRFLLGKNDQNSSTADRSPQVHSASSKPGSSSNRRSPFTRSEYSWGYISGYAGYPNFMANTESSQAKVRSVSVPKQRPESERYSYGDSASNSDNSIARWYHGTKNSAYPSSFRSTKLGSSDFQ